MEKWQVTTQRYVAFFDIMGFKDLVERSSHTEVVTKLKKLKQTISTIESLHTHEIFINEKVELTESKAITFSDSIVIFSKDDTLPSLNKILVDATMLLFDAIANRIPIKGAIALGEVTVDFNNSLFFGRPIIDSYLLHDELHLYSAILNHTVEERIAQQEIHPLIQDLFTTYRTPLKGGNVNHLLIKPPKVNVQEHIESTKKLYQNVSGFPRSYIDRTIAFLESLPK